MDEKSRLRLKALQAGPAKDLLSGGSRGARGGTRGIGQSEGDMGRGSQASDVSSPAHSEAELRKAKRLGSRCLSALSELVNF